ncbi:DUF6292 family protein [Saccharopolyspora pogona]|uniref:DUF6292 family protein n=1 Tax=Saccharopolyspora pogona TaxID=333966 RepID=UPI001CC26BE5|nr:DUF6292 family protein [Saccharopolyspora pogona]
MDMTSPAAGGLINYVRTVAGDLGDDVYEVDVDLESGLATAIILVHSKVPTLVDFPLLLTWDEVSGWALRVETDGRGDTTAIEFMGEDILPDPGLVRHFLREAISGRNPGMVQPPSFRMPNAGDDLEDRLARFAA